MVRKHNYGDRPSRDIDRAVAAVGERFSLDPKGDDARSVVARAIAEELAGPGGGDDEDLELVAARMGYRLQTASLSDVRHPRTYRRDLDRNGSGTAFFSDVLAAATRQDPDARRRLARHQAEEADGPRAGYMERATSTSNLAGLIVPAYVTSDYAFAIASARPLADCMNRHPLPPAGITVNYPVGTTPTSAAIQSSENAAVATASMSGTLGTANLQTAAGSIQLSRQAFDRSAGLSEVVVEDLLLRCSSALDAQILNQAAVGVNAVANVSTFTSASPTGALLLTAINTAAAGLAKGMQALGSPDVCVMTEPRWLWLNSQMSATLPLIQSPAPALPFAGDTENPGSTYRKGPRGALPSGIPVICDQNIVTNLGAGTNQDRVYICSTRNLHLWEAPAGPPVHVADTMPASGPIMFISANQAQAASVAVVLTAFQYFAFAANVYSNAVWATDGTGMVTQTGF